MKKFLDNLSAEAQYILGTFIGILIVVISLLSYHSCNGQELTGEFSVMSNINYGEEDASIFIQKFGLNYDARRLHLRASVDENEDVELEELYLKFDMFGMDAKIGKVPMSYGIMNQDNPRSSVFITHARENYNAYGLHLATRYDIINFEGAYSDSLDYAIKCKAVLLDGNEVFSISYAKSDSLPGDVILSNEYYFASMFLNVSNVTEWIPENGDIWTRFVLSPGIFDFFGFMTGYYHVDHMKQGLQDFDITGDIFTYGCYFDVGMETTVSLEWMIGESFDMPTAKVVARF